MEPELTVVVVLYNSASELPECLESIRADVESGWAELILVDNASPDASREVATRLLPQAKVVALSENRGFAGGVNAALGTARGPYVMLLNPDVKVPANGLRQMVDWMIKRPAVGAASPDIVNTDGTSGSPARALPSVGLTLLEMARLHRLLPSELRSRLLLGAYWNGAETLNVGWVPGTAMVVSANVVSEVGGLSDSMFMYGEDLEWCWRIRRAGYRIGVNPSCRFAHAGSASSDRTWGEPERVRRVMAGVYQAYVRMRGERYARTLALLSAVALALDVGGSARTPQERRARRSAARDWVRIAFQG